MKEIIVETLKKTIFYKWFRQSVYQTKIKDYNQPILDNKDTEDCIKELLTSKESCMVSRLGSNELKVLESFHNKKNYSRTLKYVIKNNAGVFPNDDVSLNDFSKLYFDNIKNIDLLGVWFNPFEDIIANKFCPKAKLTRLRTLEPYFSEKPWSYYLKGKKVLVIHPFADSIKSQYKNRKKLFANKRILPEFDLITYKAIQSLGGNDNFSSWFEALQYMQNEILEIDFDIAIIGAGAYGLPLAAFVKEMGKKSIHLGGSTQMLFGVYGRRWEIHPDFRDIINEHWIKPKDNERPNSAKNVENACYW